MDDNRPGKRLADAGGPSKKGKMGIMLVGTLVALLAGSYLGLCAYVGTSGTILPNTTVRGVEMGGMTSAQAADALTAKVAAQYAAGAVTVAYQQADGKQMNVQVPGSVVGVDVQDAVEAALHVGRENGFFAQGMHLLKNLAAGSDVEAPLRFTNFAEIDALLAAVAQELDRPMTETTWVQTAEALVFQKGQSGLTLDTQSAQAQILEAFEAGTLGTAPAFTLTPVTAPPSVVDLEAIQSQVFTEATDARLDVTTKEIVQSVTGISFDVAAARTALDTAAEGSTVSVPLELTEPKMTTEKLTANLFKDVLGSATSSVSGSGNRKSNVKLSAAACNDQILLPGDIFAYNETTGSRSADKGYLPAPAYVNGLSVDELGGGICQTSSTIYYATLNANLKIVERQNHRYRVGYVPDGMDATVYYGSLDFRFQNDTEYPIKVVASSYDRDGKRWLTVDILGTKADDTYVKMTNEVVSVTNAETVYKADPTVPQGAAPRPDPQSTAYTGKKVNAYRNIYSGDGKLISTTLESVNNYKKRDRVLLVNPADLAAYQAGAAPVTSPSPSVAPPVTPAPSVIPTPTATPGTTPAVTPAPVPTAPPVSTAPPAPTTPLEPTPAPTQTTPPTPTYTEPPTPTPPPTPSKEPQIAIPTSNPISSRTPDNGIPTFTPPLIAVPEGE